MVLQAWFDEGEVEPELSDRIAEASGIKCHVCGTPGKTTCDECKMKQLKDQGYSEKEITEKPKWEIQFPDTTQYELF